MGLRISPSMPEAQIEAAIKAQIEENTKWGDARDRRIFYCGLTQAAIQSMPLGQFATDVESHLKNVMATVDALTVFILERSK